MKTFFITTVHSTYFYLFYFLLYFLFHQIFLAGCISSTISLYSASFLFSLYVFVLKCIRTCKYVCICLFIHIFVNDTFVNRWYIYFIVAKLRWYNLEKKFYIYDYSFHMCSCTQGTDKGIYLLNGIEYTFKCNMMGHVSLLIELLPNKTMWIWVVFFPIHGNNIFLVVCTIFY